MFPWASLLVALPLLAILVQARAARLSYLTGRRLVLAVSTAVLVLSLGLPLRFRGAAPGLVLGDPLDPLAALGGGPLFGIDELGAWLLPFAALVFAVVVWVTPKTERDAASLRRVLFAEAVVLATFASRHEVALAVLWPLAMVPVLRELAARGPSAAAALRLFARAMGLSAALFAAGVLLLLLAPGAPAARTAATAALLIAILLRKGIVPFHSWMPPLFEQAPIGMVLLFSTPQLGAYAAVRLLAPHAPAGILHVVGAASLATAVYGALLALVQKDARRAFGFLFMSESALVLTGLECSSHTGLAGGLTIWLSSGLALTGFGMTLWVLEARRGRLSLARFHGGHEHTPVLAACFLLLGLASVGFPGTLGFVGEELLIDGAVVEFPHVGFGVVVAAAFNAITVMRAYLHLFCGARFRSDVPQRVRPREHIAFAALVIFLLAGGLLPQAVVASRSRAADEILQVRAAAR